MKTYIFIFYQEIVTYKTTETHVQTENLYINHAETHVQTENP